MKTMFMSRNDMSSATAFAPYASAASFCASSASMRSFNINLIADAIIMASVIIFAVVIVNSIISLISVAILIAVVVIIISVVAELIAVSSKRIRHS